jgi:hypothetical protein
VAAGLVVEGNPERLASVAFSALEGLVAEQRAAQLKQRLRQLGQKTVWSLNLMLMLLTSSEVRGGEVYLVQSWQRTFHADSRWSEDLQ